jgi:anti-sigma B factor antagonist
MDFDVQKNGTSTTFKLKERKLDSSLSSLVKGEFLILCKPKVDHLIIDLEDVEFCDSSGLSALLIADRKMKEHGGKVSLINVHKKVVSLLKISMLDRVFDIKEASPHATKH